MQVTFLVNEAHYFNDAVLMMTTWPQPKSDPATNEHGLSSQGHAEQSHMCALQPEQQRMQAGNQSHMSSMMLPGYCDAVMAGDDNTAQFKGEIHAPISTASLFNTSATLQVSAPQVLSSPASSNGLLIAQRLWQEVLTVSAGLEAKGDAAKAG